MSTRQQVINDAPSISSPVAKVAVTAAASAALTIPEGGRLRVVNVGTTDQAYVAVAPANTVAAAVPGAAMAAGSQAVRPGAEVIFDISGIKRDASGNLYFSAICEATKSTTLIVSVC